VKKAIQQLPTASPKADQIVEYIKLSLSFRAFYFTSSAGGGQAQISDTMLFNQLKLLTFSGFPFTFVCGRKCKVEPCECKNTRP
jgi:hypothetical protein